MDKLSIEVLKELLPGEKEFTPPPAKPRGPQMDHWPPAVLLERAAYLRKMAKAGDGSASEILKEYPQHCTMLSVRNRDGQAEVHEHFADLFYVIEGRTTLVTGGTVAGAKPVGPGEIRGDSVEGGTRCDLRVGDLAHVPAGMPHQMLVAHDQTVACFVMKIQESH